MPEAALLLALCAAFCPIASAQTAHFVGVQRAVPVSGLNLAQGIAVDQSGNIYIADSKNNQVLKVTPSAGGYTQSVVASALGGPSGVAVDGNGNVYIADTANNRVLMETPSAGSYTQSVVTGALSQPMGVAADAYGNVYIADTGNNRVLMETPSAGSFVQGSIGSGLAAPNGVAVDGGGNVYIADGGNKRVLREQLEETSYAQTTVLSGPNQPTSVAVDSNGHVFISMTASGLVVEESPSGAAYTQSLIGTVAQPSGLAVDSLGSLYIGSGAQVLKDTLSAGNFGTVDVGSTGAAISLVFAFDTAGKLGSTVVSTQGAIGLDFADDGTGTCKGGTTYTAASTCTVDVAFTPRLSGIRYGAAVLKNSSGIVLATGYVQGTGAGPQTEFLPGIQSTLPGGNSEVGGVAADASGNVYLASGGGHIFKESLSGGDYILSTIGSDLSNAEGVAVDGSGNVYIVDEGLSKVFKETLSGGKYTQTTLISGLSNPNGIAVDGSGNLYIADSSNNRVLKETLSAAGYSQTVVASSSAPYGLSFPFGVAVDASGNVYIADTTNNRVLKETVSVTGYTQNVVDGTLSGPYGVAVDGNGNLYVSTSVGTVLKETLSAGGNGYTQSTIFTGPPNYPIPGIAVDGVGNAYATPSYSPQVLKLDFADPPILGFASTAQGASSTDSPQTVTVQNLGNSALTFSAVSFPPDFPESSLDATDCAPATSLAANGSCTLTIDFSPIAAIAAGGSIALDESVAITTNTLNTRATQQKVTVHGIETAPVQTATPVFSVKAGNYEAAQSVAITDATPGAAIYYTTNGKTPTTASTLYTTAIPVSKSETIEALAVAAGYTNSAVATASYTFIPPAAPPVISVAGGTYPAVQAVVLTDVTPGATIYYTLDGTVPTTASLRYKGMFTIAASETIQAFAVAPGYINSPVASAAYTIVGSPFALAAPATLVSTPDATLNAILNTAGLSGSYYFQYGTNPADLNLTTPALSLGALTTNQLGVARVAKLASKTKYYYQVVVTTAGGAATGAVLNFTTN